MEIRKNKDKHRRALVLFDRYEGLIETKNPATGEKAREKSVIELLAPEFWICVSGARKDIAYARKLLASGYVRKEDEYAGNNLFLN